MDPSTRPPVSDALDIVAIPAFRDNYLWLLCRGNSAVVVDPGDDAPVVRVLAARGLTLRAILLTHHHADHVGGVRALVDRHAGRGAVPVYGPATERIDGVTHPLREGDRVDLEAIGCSFDVLDVPGHTRGHIAYVSRDATPLLFCGDTLFAAGCGRLFEGTPADLHASLAKLAALPPQTRVYCAHEYTLSNLRFARAVEPDSTALETRSAEAAAARAADRPTLPSTIAVERKTNPFLRTDEPAVRDAAERHTPGAGATSLGAFAALRRWKDSY